MSDVLIFHGIIWDDVKAECHRDRSNTRTIRQTLNMSFGNES